MASELRAGEVVEGRYRLEAKLGEGGYGAVWRANQLNLNRPVAIKFLKAVVADPSAAKRFDRESKALARLQHPNCVTLLDFGHSPYGSFLVTEFLDGWRLDDWVAEGPLVSEVLVVALQILTALDHAHSQKIIHRDLKPANIVIAQTPDGDPLAKVLDFGIASVVGAKRGDITKTGEVFGTPGYMSPEQLLGEMNVGPTGDLYSFGVLLYQMLQGERLFSGSSGIEVAMKHLTHEPPQITASIPLGLQDVVSKLLRKTPTERFQSASEVSRAIAALTSSGQYPQEALSPAPQTQRPAPPAGWTRPTVNARPLTPPSKQSGVRPRATLMPPAAPTGGWSNQRLALLAGALVVVIAIAGLVSLHFYERIGQPQPAAQNPSAVSGLVKSNDFEVTPLPTLNPSIAPDMGRQRTSDGCLEPAPGLGYRNVSVMAGGGLDRLSARVFVPEGYDSVKPHPIVLLFHDVNQTPRNLVEELDLHKLADRDGVILLLAEHNTPFYTWDDPDTWDKTMTELEAAKARLCIDLDRVYLYGHGAGGNAAENVACLLDSVAAMAVSSHRLMLGTKPCEAHADIPYMLLAPLKDGRDPVEGGPGCLGGESVVSIAAHEQAFRTSHRCDEDKLLDWNEAGSKCWSWTCVTAFASCHLAGGRPFPDTNFRIDPCEGDAADFPYAEKIWSFFASAKPFGPGNPLE